MKRLLLSLAAAAVLASPILTATTAEAQPDWRRHDDHGNGRGQDRGGDRRDYDRGDRGDRGRGQGPVRGDDRGRGYDRGRAEWDQGRHNGYFYNNRWYYGPPPQAYYGNPYYRPGYTAWRRGSVLPPYYRSYYVNDYYRYHLRPPPRGYAWYRVGDDYLLAAVATGLIFEIINH